jgi:predicted nucleic acid-binding Zn ribbon protein
MSPSGSWYSEEPPRREPHKLGDTLGEVARGLGLPDPNALAAVLAAWPGMVGDAIGAHSRPRSLRNGVLTVAVDSPVWGTQLRYLEADLVQRAREHAPVTSLRLVVEQSS